VRPSLGTESARPLDLWRITLQVLAVGGSAALSWLLVRHLHHQPSHDWFDLKVYRGAVHWWLTGRPLYSFVRPDSVYGFTYPPFAALVLVPLDAVPLPVAIVLHTAVCVAVVVAGTWWLVRPVARRLGWTPWFATGLAVPVVLITDPVRETIGLGQVNLVLAALVLTDLVALRRGRAWAGVGIGLAAALKLTPAVFVLYLLVTRRWRAAGVATGTALAASAGAAALSPLTSDEFWLHALWETSRVGQPAKASNQSREGGRARLADPGTMDRPLWLLLVAVVLVVGLWRARRAAQEGDELVGFTLTGVVGCLISPISWSHHLVWLVPAVVVLVDVAAGAQPARSELTPTRRWLSGVGAAAITVALCTGVFWYASPARGAPHPHDPVGLLTENAYTVVMLVLLVLLPPRAAPPVAGEPRAAVRA
jgi:alpha-1,2-mannosyltransferase